MRLVVWRFASAALNNYLGDDVLVEVYVKYDVFEAGLELVAHLHYSQNMLHLLQLLVDLHHLPYFLHVDGPPYHICDPIRVLQPIYLISNPLQVRFDIAAPLKVGLFLGQRPK